MERYSRLEKIKLMLYKEHNLCEHFVIYSQGGIKVVTP